MKEETVESDVLCIGGGIAGLMAAIRAGEKGRKVVVAEKANTLLGFSKNQNIGTKGTLYNMLARIRDFLVFKHQGNEKHLEDWGFKIIVSTSKRPKSKELKRKKKADVPI